MESSHIAAVPDAGHDFESGLVVTNGNSSRVTTACRAGKATSDRTMTKVVPPRQQKLLESTSVQVSSGTDDGSASSRQTSLGPPDGGWGWVVVMASFMCNVIVDGIIFSFGILLLEISATFKESIGRTAWIGSLQAGSYLVVGPLVSSLANKYGCRRVTIAGSLIASFGFIISFWADSVLLMALTFGMIGGIGFGFIYLPAIVTVGYYFEKRRAFATGIAVCGSGIGAFSMPHLIQYLNENYGWRGCILILSGLVLNCAVFGSLFRPAPSAAPAELFESRKPLLRSKDDKDTMWPEEFEDLDAEGIVTPTSSENSAPPSYTAVIDADRRGRLSLDETRTGLLPTSTTTELMAKTIAGTVCTTANETKDSQTSLSSQTRKFTQSLKSLMHEPDPILYNELPHTDVTVDCGSPTEDEDELNSPRQSNSNGIQKRSSSDSKLSNKSVGLADSLDMSLLRSPSFLLLAFSGFLTLAGFFIPFMYIVDKAVLAGIPPEHGAYLLSIIGITNTVGRVFCGWISDRPQVNALLINNTALVVGGGVTLLSPLFFNTFLSLSVYCSIFGFSIALRSVITVELLGLERLTSAFGLLLLPQGIATIIGAPFAGWLFDTSGSYDGSFYVSGAVILISGLMCFPLPAIARWEKRAKSKL